jgi:hypothetical protein
MPKLAFAAASIRKVGGGDPRAPGAGEQGGLLMPKGGSEKA